MMGEAELGRAANLVTLRLKAVVFVLDDEHWARTTHLALLLDARTKGKDRLGKGKADTMWSKCEFNKDQCRYMRNDWNQKQHHEGKLRK